MFQACSGDWGRCKEQTQLACWQVSVTDQLWRCRNLPAKIGDVLTPQQYKEVEELGILVDKDPEVCPFCVVP